MRAGTYKEALLSHVAVLIKRQSTFEDLRLGLDRSSPLRRPFPGVLTITSHVNILYWTLSFFWERVRVDWAMLVERELSVHSLGQMFTSVVEVATLYG